MAITVSTAIFRPLHSAGAPFRRPEKWPTSLIKPIGLTPDVRLRARSACAPDPGSRSPCAPCDRQRHSLRSQSKPRSRWRDSPNDGAPDCGQWLRLRCSTCASVPARWSQTALQVRAPVLCGRGCSHRRGTQQTRQKLTMAAHWHEGPAELRFSCVRGWASAFPPAHKSSYIQSRPIAVSRWRVTLGTGSPPSPRISVRRPGSLRYNCVLCGHPAASLSR